MLIRQKRFWNNSNRYQYERFLPAAKMQIECEPPEEDSITEGKIVISTRECGRELATPAEDGCSILS